MNQITTATKTSSKAISIANAALISGIGLLIMAFATPVAEFYIFPKLTGKDPAITAKNIVDNRLLFTTGILLHFITVICDVVVAWALYVFLKPVFKQFALLTAWFRLIYAAMYLIALFNLLKVLNLAASKTAAGPSGESWFDNSITFYINSFHQEWSFALIVFGIYLILLGWLVLKAPYVPKLFGILLIIAGFGYFINTLVSLLFPNINTAFLFITFFGELIFMVWLLVKGRTVKDKEIITGG